ncbi:MAG: tetratricopeptide repeat protein [Candidatus Electrothrix sp. EH2]|nr:tetratricopeptide repeat protein [Candidatus Electrothrix sp. EH2]
MQWLTDTAQWLWNHPEVTWSGAGLTALGVLFVLLSKVFAAFGCKNSVPPVGNTFTKSDNIANVYMHQSEWETALPYLEQCLPIRKEVGDKYGEGITLNNIAITCDAKGEPGKAVEYHEQALAIRRELGDRDGEALTCWNIGHSYKNMGDLAKAEEYIAMAVEIEEAIGSPNLEDSRKGLALVQAKRQGA